MIEDQSTKAVYDAIKERGRLFLVMYRELLKRFGKQQAVEIMRSTAYEFGRPIGQSLACFAPNDFSGIAENYAKPPCDGAIFSPDIRKLDGSGLEVQMMSCPIKDSWVEAGCSDEEICFLLYCASALDEATFEEAGFDYEIELWSPGRKGCCLTRLTVKEPS